MCRSKRTVSPLVLANQRGLSHHSVGKHHSRQGDQSTSDKNQCYHQWIGTRHTYPGHIRLVKGRLGTTVITRRDPDDGSADGENCQYTDEAFEKTAK